MWQLRIVPSGYQRYGWLRQSKVKVSRNESAVFDVWDAILLLFINYYVSVSWRSSKRIPYFLPISTFTCEASYLLVSRHDQAFVFVFNWSGHSFLYWYWGNPECNLALRQFCNCNCHVTPRHKFNCWCMLWNLLRSSASRYICLPSTRIFVQLPEILNSHFSW